MFRRPGEGSFGRSSPGRCAFRPCRFRLSRGVRETGRPVGSGRCRRQVPESDGGVARRCSGGVRAGAGGVVPGCLPGGLRAVWAALPRRLRSLGAIAHIKFSSCREGVRSPLHKTPLVTRVTGRGSGCGRAGHPCRKARSVGGVGVRTFGPDPRGSALTPRTGQVVDSGPTRPRRPPEGP